MKYKFILENRGQYRLGKMCKILNVSRSGYHRYLKQKVSQRQRENQWLLEQIKNVYNRFRCVYGSPRIYKELRKTGIKCNKKRVVRIMRINGIKAKTKRRYKVTTNSGHNYPVSENILKQNFNAARPNEKWVSDITYVWTKQGWLYLVCIVDLYSRMIVGWTLDISLKSSMVITALKQAIVNRGENPGLIFHSDRGSQYASEEVKSFLRQKNIIQSMSRKGNCYDNAVAESFFHTIKSELISFELFNTRQEAKMKIFEYIEIFYNRYRSHSALNYFSPIDYEKKLNIKLVA